MHRRIPNPKTWRPWLGEDVNQAFFELADEMNRRGMTELEYPEYMRKMIRQWWEQVFPDMDFPADVKEYYYDLDLDCQIVQSA